MWRQLCWQRCRMFEVRHASKTSRVQILETRDASRVVWRLRCCGDVWPDVLWKAEQKWKATGWGFPFAGRNENEHVLRCVMWAENYWLFCDNKERLVCMVNDIIEALLDLDMGNPSRSCCGETSTSKDDPQYCLEWQHQHIAHSTPSIVISGRCVLPPTRSFHH